MPIHIAIVTPGQFAASADRASSVERVVEEMAKRLDPDRYRVTIYSKLALRTLPKEQIGHVTHLRIPAASRQSYMRKVIQHLKKNKPDLIQIDNRPKTVPLFRSHFPSKPIILSLHSTTFVQPHKYGRRLLQSCFNQADRIITNSQFLACWLQSRYRCHKKTAVCYPGVDTDRFVSKYTEAGQEQRELLRDELGYRHKKMVLFIGRLIPIKGVHHLLDVWPAVIAEHDDAVLVICGSARYGSDSLTPYVQRLHRLGNTMPHHVRFFPYILHSKLAAWYQAADVVVVPSAKDEAFGLVNVEALASGTPVVSMRAGGIPEIIEHDVNGLLVDPAAVRRELSSALRTLLGDRDRRERMGKQGVQHVIHTFTWEHTARRYAAVYETFIHSGSGANLGANLGANRVTNRGANQPGHLSRRNRTGMKGSQPGKSTRSGMSKRGKTRIRSERPGRRLGRSIKQSTRQSTRGNSKSRQQG